jgi:hypothetical protein
MRAIPQEGARWRRYRTGGVWEHGNGATQSYGLKTEEFCMRKMLLFGMLSISGFAFGQNTASWDKGEKELFLGLTPFLRPQVLDLGGTINDYFYNTKRSNMEVEQPVKIAKGKYCIRCIQRSEYTDDKVYVTFNFVRNTSDGAFIETIDLQQGDGGQKATASTFEEKAYILMSGF